METRPPAAPASPASPAPQPAAAGPALPFTWETEFALLTDRFVLYDGVKLVSWTYLIIAAIFSPILLVRGEAETIPVMLRAFVYTLAGLALVGALVMLVVFRNRCPARVTISEDGVRLESTSRAGKTGNRLAILIGALGRSATTAGAGLLGRAGETVTLEWGELRRVNAHDDHCVLSLMNGWRVVMRLYCTPENYGTVAALIAARAPHARRSA